MSLDAPPGRHPLCDCPPITFTGPPPDRSKCRGGSIAHPAIGTDEIRALLEGQA